VSGLAQTAHLYVRVMRSLLRQPIWIFFMLVQPMFWLLLYSQLFRRITELPGFGTHSYIDYLTPGIAVMTAFFSGSWAGMGTIEDLDRGVVERFLTTPARRSAIVSPLAGVGTPAADHVRILPAAIPRAAARETPDAHAGCPFAVTSTSASAACRARSAFGSTRAPW